MSETTEALIGRVLGEHNDPLFYGSDAGWCWRCDCDQKGAGGDMTSDAAEIEHRAHVAAAIAEAVREWLTARRQEVAEAIAAPSHARIRANGYVPMTTADDWLAEADAVLVSLTAKGDA